MSLHSCDGQGSGYMLDNAFERLELLKSGTQFAKTDRLYKWLRGYHMANDFARTEEAEDDAEVLNKRNEKLKTLVQTLRIDERTHGEPTTKRIPYTKTSLVNANNPLRGTFLC